MKNILLILTGGTICTAVTAAGTRAISEKAAARLKENFFQSHPEYKDIVRIESSENFHVLSENMSIEIWNRLIVYLRTVDFSAWDGIIFAHGTDTLAYSAAMFSYVLAACTIPVFFVSANCPLEHPHTNGNANFKAAVDCILAGIKPNVYVTYRNISDGKMYLHLGSHIRQCENYSEDFKSFDACDISTPAYRNAAIKACPQKKRAFVSLTGQWFLKPCVLMLEPYVGMNYDAFCIESYRAILHGTYHSGTVCVGDAASYGETSALHLLDRCEKKKVRVWFSPAKSDGEVYDSVPALIKHRARPCFLWGLTKEAAYAKLVLLYSLYDDEAEIEKQMIED